MVIIATPANELARSFLGKRWILLRQCRSIPNCARIADLLVRPSRAWNETGKPASQPASSACSWLIQVLKTFSSGKNHRLYSYSRARSSQLGMELEQLVYIPVYVPHSRINFSPSGFAAMGWCSYLRYLSIKIRGSNSNLLQAYTEESRSHTKCTDTIWRPWKLYWRWNCFRRKICGFIVHINSESRVTAAWRHRGTNHADSQDIFYHGMHSY